MPHPFKLEHNKDLQPLHSFALPAMAQNYIGIDSISQLPSLYQYVKEHPQPSIILGEGSNSIFCGSIDALVIHNQLLGVTTVKQNDQYVWLECAAGENWHQLVKTCIEQDLAGIENLSLIPGSVGAAPVQNIGAYGAELSDTLQSVTAFDLQQGDFCQLSAADCQLGYRDSIFKQSAYRGRYFITSILLKLCKKKQQFKLEYGQLIETLTQMGAIDQPSLHDISQAVIQIRQSKLPDPALLPNAGSFFKNPIIEKNKWDLLQKKHPTMIGYPMPSGRVKVAAAWLLEQCGWRGQRIGGLGCHAKQALVIIHYGGASDYDLTEFIKSVTADVYDTFAIKLTPEVNIYRSRSVK